MPHPSDDTFPSAELYLQPPEAFFTESVAAGGGLSMSPLNEEFRDPQGSWEHYDAYDPTLRAVLRDRKHVDIRDFNSADKSAPLSVLDLSKLPMNALAGSAVQSLDDPLHVIVSGEHWSLGTNIVMPTHNYWRVLELPIDVGFTETESQTLPIDIETGFDDDDFISLAMPSFPLDWIDPSISWLDLTSHPEIDWNQGSYRAHVLFEDSITPLINGNSQLKVRRSDLIVGGDDFDLSSITGVRIMINSPYRASVNNLPNPTFDNASTGWASYVDGGTSTLTITTEQARTGANSAKATATSAATGMGAISTLGTAIVVLEGESLFAAGYSRAFSTTRNVSMRIAWYDSGNNLLSTTDGTASSNSSTAWTRHSVVGVAPVGTTKARVYMYHLSVANGEVHYMDDFVAGVGDIVPPYFDGDSVGAVWSGTAHNSSSYSPTVKLASLRLLSKDWQFGQIDTNTRRGTLVRTVSPNANPIMTTDFSQPIVWRAAEVPGQADPKPINFNLAVGFNTGSRQGSNNISIYGRELTEDFMQQLDINGLAQAELTGRDQPDLGQAAFNPRLQSDLSPFKQDQLEGLEQFDLERTPDYLSASWIQFVVQWTTTNTQVSVVNTEGNGYNFSLGTPLAANTDYVLVFELVDTAARAAIYPLGARGQIIFNAPVFDSTLIDDDFSYKRRKGRFGWYANLADGDAYIDSIRFRSANYAEYRSLPYESITPVVGSELSAESSPIIDLFDSFYPTETSVRVESDREVTLSGNSFRVTDYGDYTYQGIQSNEFDITDFDQTEVLLDVYYPSTLDQDAGLEFYLKNQADYLITLPKPKIFPDQWQTIRLRTPSTHLAQTGLYRFVIVQSKPVNLNWWVDNVRVFERSVSWHGRAVVEDPWAATEDDWTPFQNSLNRDYGGILFQGRERKLQIKGVGHKQDSKVAKIQFKPKYAEIGRFVWPEDALTGLEEPVASYATSNIGRVYTFNGFGSTDPDGQVINWYWTVSDGSVYVGPIIQHTFGQAGTYTVALTVTDHNGLVNSTVAIHSVV